METAVELIEVELKYCERCGGIWLRQKGREQVYCADCEPEMAQFPEPTVRHKPPATSCAESVRAFGYLYGLGCAEGRA